jgi:hypothetical protein
VTGESNKDLFKIVNAARDHYKAVNSDIANAKDRYEHIRLTALAQQAHNLLLDLIEFETGIVYTHTAETARNQFAERIHSEADTLDIPDFKSPYDPRSS